LETERERKDLRQRERERKNLRQREREDRKVERDLETQRGKESK
jgi:hypothetical protein